MRLEDWFDKGQAPRAGALHVVEMLQLEGPDAVRAVLRQHEGSGWICTTDGVHRVPSSAMGEAVPLCGEVVLSPERSLHLRQHGTGWKAWILEDVQGNGEELSFDESFLSTEGTARLRYRIWWRLEVADDESGIKVWRPYASRFLGWEDR